MKKLSEKTKVLMLAVAVIVIIGIIITLTLGLKFDLRYEEAQKIELYLNKEFKNSEIKEITNEVLQNKDVMIQKVEVYEDTVSILAKEITEEEKTNIINKVNEKYQTEIKEDSVEIEKVPHTRGRDLIKPYVMPMAITTSIVLIYMIIRFYKLGITKTIIETIAILVLAQAVLLSIIAIARIPVGRLTIPMVLGVYVLTLLGVTSKFEKSLKENVEE